MTNNNHSKSRFRKFSIPHSQFLIVLLLLLPTLAFSARMYNPFVWTTYRDFSYITSITANMQRVYFGTENGILRYNRLLKQWEEPITKSNGFPGMSARVVAFDKMFRKLWIAYENGLVVYNPDISHWEREISRTSIPLSSITSIGFTQDSVYLENNGLFAVSPRGMYNWTRRVGSLPTNILWSGEKGNIEIENYTFLTPYYATDEYFNKYKYTAGIVDNQDLWLGTEGFDVFHYNVFTWSGTHYTVGLAGNRVDAIYKDENEYWIGGIQTNGITRINFLTGEGSHYRSEDIFRLDSHEINAITGDERNIWFGTREGLVQYGMDENQWDEFTQFDGLPHNNVISLQRKDDTLFIGTEDGLAYLLPGAEDPISIDEFSDIAIHAFGIFEGDLVICTDEGVFLRKGDSIKTITDPDGDFSFGVTAVFVDSTTLWFGTRRNGVDVYSTDSLEWKEYLSPTPLAGEWVYDIKGNKGFIWIATDQGVSRYNKKTDSWYSFDESDGLAHYEVHTIFTEDDYVWFGTKNGLTRFKYRDYSVPQ
jgi:ligand-binding sensor domain-containing protein